MTRKIFHELVSLDEALKIVEKYYPLKPLGVEEVDLINALRRVLATDIYSPIDHPPFDRSEVDGYAVNSLDVAGADDLHPVTLKVLGKISAGEYPSQAIGKGETIEISTGAMIPRGADSVVMVEYTKKVSNDRVMIYRSTYPGENIATTGSDVSMGDLVALKGTLIDGNLIGFLAGLGIYKVKVYKRPKIAVYSTGDEVILPGNNLEPGKVYDVNGYLITSKLKEIGADAVFMGKLPDNYEEIRSKITEALSWADIVITSGGTSAGFGDLIYKVFDNLGEPGIVVHGLKVKPGKPTVISVVGNKLLIGLPGFPLSCYMIFDQLVVPIVEKLVGLRKKRMHKFKTKIPYRIKKPLGKTWLLPVTIIKGEKGLVAYPVSLKSGSITPLITSDGYIKLPETTDIVLEDTEWDVFLFRDITDLPELTIIGSNDVLLYELLRTAGIIEETKIVPTGSMGGLIAIKRGEADIAPIHLLDEVTLEYNVPFIKKFGLGDKTVLIRGYLRRIGLIIKKWNPKNIKGIDDFLRDDIVMVNRTKGSGIRVYTDYMLKQLAHRKNIDFRELVKKIKGYTYEVKTHTAVAAAVKHGRADVGIGAEVAARMYDLDFIPLTWENYDFLIKKSSLNKE
ncbi:MAG: molybdopterin biosynthesis protein, partial [Staphylothermus sp.]|nr:molybdopterin biosynthesis protein [Staphylothermus sp.]